MTINFTARQAQKRAQGRYLAPWAMAIIRALLQHFPVALFKISFSLPPFLADAHSKHTACTHTFAFFFKNKLQHFPLKLVLVHAPLSTWAFASCACNMLHARTAATLRLQGETAGRHFWEDRTGRRRIDPERQMTGKAADAAWLTSFSCVCGIFVLQLSWYALHHAAACCVCMARRLTHDLACEQLSSLACQ